MAQSLTRDGTQSARGLTARKLKATLVGTRNNNFLRLVERTEEAFAQGEDTAVADVRNILEDVRKQYDHVHAEAEKRQRELERMREAVKLADQAHGVGAESLSRGDDSRAGILKQTNDTLSLIKDAQTTKKVYSHMFNRVTKEQVLLKEKLLVMEAHLQRKSGELQRKEAQHQGLSRKGAQVQQDLDVLEMDAEHERTVRLEATRNIEVAMQSRKETEERRAQFEKWQMKVALDAANEAFNASAGRLRKLYAVEKLAGNSLQKITFEQVERSQSTEDGFQKIREVTGLTDVMDIVHKFLNREVEHEQLQASVREAEVRLEALREKFAGFKKNTDGLAFDTNGAGATRTLYLDVEEHETHLNQVLKDHELGRQALQSSTVQIEHMKRWAARVGGPLRTYEDLVRVEKPADLPVFLQQLQRAVDRFIAVINQQGKVQKKNMAQIASKEYHEATRLLTDKEFLRVNCRVPTSLDAGRPATPQRPGQKDDEDLLDVQHDRERLKAESLERQRVELQRKKPGGTAK